MHRVGRSDQSGRVGHNPRRGTNRDAVPSDNDDPLPFEFLLRKKLEWRQDNKVVDGDGRIKYFRFVGISVMMSLVCAAPFAPAGPFEWPHPVFWSLVTCVAVWYQMGLTLLFVQALAVRDYWMLHVMSVIWELMEYSLEHQVDLDECWWDHALFAGDAPNTQNLRSKEQG
ncbi:PTDSS2 [Branchiostoma lanceolatum]|uniref:Phosphatidylserine synthase n=1 Tax=Branchiostoma lanceolatum TaxID=7740 RepID=A0A8J9ZJN6_BRALA|nr:PTDSS2 [Branchiostoma lanceolatum]